VDTLSNDHTFKGVKLCLLFIKTYGLHFVLLSKFLQEKNTPVSPYAWAHITQFQHFLTANTTADNFGAEIHNFIINNHVNRKCSFI